MSYVDENTEYQHEIEHHPASSDYFVYQEQQVDLQIPAQLEVQQAQDPSQQQYQPAQQPPQQQYQPAQQPPQPQYQPAQQPPQPQYQPAQQPLQPQYQPIQKPPQPQYQPQPPQQQWQFQHSQNPPQYQPAQKPQSPLQYQPAVGYPPTPPYPTVATEGWSTDLFGCLENPENALITACCPCVTFGQIAEVIDNGHTTCATSGALYFGVLFCIAMPCLMSYSYRTKLRSKYNLVESPASDCLTHLFCEPCALCQEFNELKHRGLDPSIGWQGNLALQQQQQNYAMTPPRNNPMMH